MGEDHVDLRIQPYPDLTEQGAGSNICWRLRPSRSRTGWSLDTAALQFFAHLDGEALQVALLMPDRIRERWKDLVNELSMYYSTPGRLAVFRRQFENARRRPGLDLATFATEFGILDLRGFSDMKDIVAQQSCDFPRYLDGAAPEATIWDIVDSCRVWQSHAEPIVIDNWCQNSGDM